MTQQDALDYWTQSARQNRQVALDNFKMRHYDWSLFFWHLVIEKALKAILVKRGQSPQPIHNLRQLAVKTGLEFTPEQIDQLQEISTFNLEARYDDYKLSFYKKATKEFAQQWSKRAEEIYLWLLKHLND